MVKLSDLINRHSAPHPETSMGHGEYQRLDMIDRKARLAGSNKMELLLFSSHNSKYSKQSAGDHARDLIDSRDKRMFTDPTGSRATTNKGRFNATWARAACAGRAGA